MSQIQSQSNDPIQPQSNSTDPLGSIRTGIMNYPFTNMESFCPSRTSPHTQPQFNNSIQPQSNSLGSIRTGIVNYPSTNAESLCPPRTSPHTQFQLNDPVQSQSKSIDSLGSIQTGIVNYPSTDVESLCPPRTSPYTQSQFNHYIQPQSNSTDPLGSIRTSIMNYPSTNVESFCSSRTSRPPDLLDEFIFDFRVPIPMNTLESQVSSLDDPFENIFFNVGEVQGDIYSNSADTAALFSEFVE